VHFVEMHDRVPGMIRRHLGMTLAAMRNGLFQLSHTFIKMRIRDVLLCHVRMVQGFLGMRHNSCID